MKFYIDTYLKTKENPRELIVTADNIIAWGINPHHPYWYDRCNKMIDYGFSEVDLEVITKKEALQILKKWNISLYNCPAYTNNETVKK